MKQKIKSLFWWLLKISWQIWLLMFLVSAVVSVLALRSNNTHMVKLVNAVQAADKNNQDIEGALQNLQTYVTGHMNTNLTVPNGVYPPIQLTYTYQRLTTKASDTTYHDAQVYCEKHQPVGFYGAYRLGCVENYIESHPSTSGQKANVPAALYEFNFVSPTWSPDLAGWSLIATGISFAGLLGSFLNARLNRN